MAKKRVSKTRRPGDVRGIVETVLVRAVDGAGAHADTATVFEGLDWRLAGERPGGAPHSTWQLLNHVIFWNQWGVEWMTGKDPSSPDHAAGSWPGKVAPASQAEWNKGFGKLRAVLDQLKRLASAKDPLVRQGVKSRAEMVTAIGSHSSYHAGQVVLLRRQLGAWPPPSGGLTW